MSVFLCSTDGKFHCIDSSKIICSVSTLRRLASDFTGVPPEDFHVTLNGKIINACNDLHILPGDVFRVQTHLPGGKGGFGSMLRAIGAQIEKTTNREACRDLSGRRMRDVNDEKKIAEWVTKQAEREAEKARRKQERLARLKAEPKHTFDDTKYTSQLQANAEQIGDALQQGLRAASATPTSVPSTSFSDFGTKRKNDQEQKRSKKSRMWFGSDEDEELEDLSVSSGERQDCHAVTMTTCTSTTTSGESSSAATNQSDSISIASSSCSPSTTEERRVLDPTANGTGQTSCAEQQENDNNSEEEMRGDMTSLAPSTTVTVSKQTNDQSTIALEITPLDLDKYNSVSELEVVGMDRLKSALMSLGLKCGGTLQQRAERLFATKGIPVDELDPSFFAKPSTGKKGKGKKPK